jgi:hypothetical protein
MQHAALQAPRAAPPRAPEAPQPDAPGGGGSGGGGTAAAAGAVSTSEALALLGGGGGDEDGDLAGGPLWFKKEAFTAPEFDPDEYVRDLRRYVRGPRCAENAFFFACAAFVPRFRARARGGARARARVWRGALTLRLCGRRCRWRRCARSWTRT